MFVVLYQFKVRPGREEEFRESWRELTKAIHRHRGSYGSRLHRTTNGTFVAYAQWPSEERFDADAELPMEFSAVRQTMRDSCESIATIEKMTVVDDLLQPPVAQG